MRTIGRRNIEMVKNETRRAIREEGHYQIEQLVIDRLPDSLLENSEKYYEISNTISDTIMETHINIAKGGL